jgi:hypothetical protein
MHRSTLMFRRFWMIAAAGAACCGGVARGDDVTLRASVRLPAEAGAVLLKHIAELNGAEAQRLGDVMVHSLDGRGGASLVCAKFASGWTKRA